jgi:membrane-associated phospholipid phosphatase
MKPLLAALLTITTVGLAQTTPAPDQAASQQTSPQQAPPVSQPPDQNRQQEDRNRSVLEVKPGGEAIKQKDLWDQSGYFHPFARMPKYVLQDQKAIWTSPFHTAKKDIKWWAIFGTAAGVLIATDKYAARNMPNTSAQTHLGADFSNIGAAYTLIPISAGFYFLGTAAGSDHFRETGMLCFETLIDTTIMETIIKSATDRARPLEGNGKGGFWESSGSPYNASFPSGHSINTFGMASIFAHEYPHKWWVKLLAYGYAGTVVGARLAARKHFPSDVVVGGALGWFTGDYVYAKRHNSGLDKKRSAIQSILAHVTIGGAGD